jgi:hypothetical protein
MLDTISHRDKMPMSIRSAEIIDVLNDALRLLCRGLPQYLVEAKPWLQSGDNVFLASLRNLIADQRHYAGRVANAVAERGGRPDPGPFPLEYSSANDLALDFLKKKILEQLHDDHIALARAAKQLANQPDLHPLVEEIVGNYRGHLEVLDDAGEGGRGKGKGGNR